MRASHLESAYCKLPVSYRRSKLKMFGSSWPNFEKRTCVLMMAAMASRLGFLQFLKTLPGKSSCGAACVHTTLPLPNTPSLQYSRSRALCVGGVASSPKYYRTSGALLRMRAFFARAWARAALRSCRVCYFFPSFATFFRDATLRRSFSQSLHIAEYFFTVRDFPCSLIRGDITQVCYPSLPVLRMLRVA